jgi:hypothetical protein
VVATVPVGVPPTLTSAPSRRPKRSLAAATSRPGVAGSALSAATQAAVSAAAAFRARRAAAAAAVASWGSAEHDAGPVCDQCLGPSEPQGRGCRRSPGRPCRAIPGPCRHLPWWAGRARSRRSAVARIRNRS